MSRMPIDDRPGAIPDVTAEDGSVTYVLPIAGSRDTTRLVIRCDADGNVWVAIRRAPALRWNDAA